MGDNSSRDISPYKKSFRHSFIDDGRESILVTGSTNMRLLPRVLSSIYCAKASHAQLPDILSPKRYTSSSLYREYSSYPVEEKVSFSRRKKHLLVVAFFYLRT